MRVTASAAESSSSVTVSELSVGNGMVIAATPTAPRMNARRDTVPDSGIHHDTERYMNKHAANATALRKESGGCHCAVNGNRSPKRDRPISQRPGGRIL